MLKKSISRILIALLIAAGGTSVQAQILPTDVDYYAPYEYEGVARDEKDLFSYSFALGGGISFAMGQWAATPALSASIFDPVTGEAGMGAGYGSVFTAAQRLSFSYETLNQWHSIGHWSLQYCNNGYNELNASSQIFSNQSSSQLSFGIGGGVAYNYENKFGFESELTVYLPVIGTAPSFSYLGHSQTDNDDFFIDPAEYDAAWYPGVGFSVALRSRRWRLSAEIYTIKHKSLYTYTHYEPVSGKEIVDEFTGEFRVTTFRLGLDYLLSF